jgi:hypothetical protein
MWRVDGESKWIFDAGVSKAVIKKSWFGRWTVWIDGDRYLSGLDNLMAAKHGANLGVINRLVMRMQACQSALERIAEQD